MVELGRKYRDVITGFEGVVTGRCEYLTGCSQALVIPSCAADGSFKEGQWFDEQRLQVVGEEIIALDNGQTPGCDIAAPKQ